MLRRARVRINATVVTSAVDISASFKDARDVSKAVWVLKKSDQCAPSPTTTNGAHCDGCA
jgi:hypothetical protein